MLSINQLLTKTKGDRVIWITVILLTLISSLAVYSSTGSLAFKYQGGNTEYYLLKHLSIFLVGIGIMYLAHLVNYKYYSRVAQLLLIISIPLLAFTLFFGVDINNAKRWLTIPIINLSFQTSDLAKLALIMYMARVLSKKQETIKDFKTGFLPAVIPPLIICALIAPSNLSTASILFATCILLMFIGRVKLKYIFSMIGAGILALALIIIIALFTPFHARVLTWQSRIDNFMNDDKGSYQVQQAKIAIANGGVIGSGPGNSKQRNFLPSPYADFIYAIIIEEYGLVGAFIIVALYLLFLQRCIKIFIKSPGAFGAFLAIGLSFALVFQALINMAVAVNLLPVTGVTLPLISMGGTSIWFTSISIGIILSVSRYVEQEDQKQHVQTA
ncbi:MAG: FtsW/RodA/SpoVE family cell cycle protein [Bacteroidetes bacterium]|nr:FtsW/RodA/SpoVE family cell cycle protein [Bacteroidota bacterium]